MVKALQKKFIIAAMIVVTILLVTLVGAINILNYVSVTDLQERMLEILCETDAQPERSQVGPGKNENGRDNGMTGENPSFRERESGFPGTDSGEPGEGSGDGFPGDRKNAQEEESRDPGADREPQEGEAAFGKKRSNGSILFRRRVSLDDMMSIRYFAVWFDENGEIVRSDVSRIYSVSEEEALEIGKNYYDSLVKNGKKKGASEGFRYVLDPEADSDKSSEGVSGVGNTDDIPSASPTDGDLSSADTGTFGSGGEDKGGSASGTALSAGESLLIVMDTSGDTRDLLAVLGISSLIAALCWIAMLLPVYLLARLAIAPTALSIERQKQFVTNAGHELKTPVAIIQTNTEALELFTGESKWTRNIRTQTERLNGLMQNLLTLSRMDESGLDLKLQPLPLGTLVSDIWENFAEPADSKNLTFKYQKPADGTDMILGNRDTVSQLLSILFDNAVKYTPAGGEITVSVSRNSGNIRLVQSNTVPRESGEGKDGKGGLPEDPNRLFERFYRADQARTRKKGGYGIGLSAARAIAEANRGSIRAESGTGIISFIVTFRKEA